MSVREARLFHWKVARWRPFSFVGLTGTRLTMVGVMSNIHVANEVTSRGELLVAVSYDLVEEDKMGWLLRMC